MTREEIQKKIEEVENQIFINQMCDHWGETEVAYDIKKRAELKELMDQLEETKDEV